MLNKPVLIQAHNKSVPKKRVFHNWDWVITPEQKDIIKYGATLHCVYNGVVWVNTIKCNGYPIINQSHEVIECLYLIEIEKTDNTFTYYYSFKEQK